MLVLSRHMDEEIVIGDNIFIRVVDIRGDKARLGIVAPTDVPVHRKEVWDAIQREKLQEKKGGSDGKGGQGKSTDNPGR